ncbi:MAG: ABC transporter ATP-binding protein [Thermodesulfobacteriota bacterium]|jgi:lipopolysaccharide transport system ATP-binding protein
MIDIAIKVETLSKLYRIGSRQKGYKTIRESIVNAVAAPFRRLSSTFGRRSSFSDFPSAVGHSIWALRDISFEVKRGEVVGLIGSNGAGKSTLLKILSRITEPTHGYAEIHGRLGALLEVGTGIHPELTGRENIFLTGAILGMGKGEIERKFDEIVAFAEVDKFIDTPVKHYSTGMMVRLAFAVAAHLEPEILLVDEVLAVGDMAFQKKCLGKMEETTKGGRTVLFVSHNMGAIRQLCNRVFWLDQGKLMANGGVEKVVADYQAESSKGFIQRNLESDFLRIEAVILQAKEGQPRSSFRPGEDLVIEIHFFAKKFIRKPYFWVTVVSQYGSLIGASMLLDGHQPDSIDGDGTLTCTLRNIPLLPQTYSVRMGVRAENGVVFLIRTAEVAFFTVEGTAKSLGFKEERADTLMGNGAPVVIPYEWKLPDGRTFSVNPKWVKPYEKMFSNPED